MEPATSGVTAGASASVGAQVAAPATRRCPLCGQTVPADGLGLYECVCGWGGPGDPLEAARGISRTVTIMDRRMASEQAQRDLRRLRTPGKSTISTGYAIVLALASTLIYVVLIAGLVASIFLGYLSVLDAAWLGTAFCVLFAAMFIFMLYPRRPRPRGIEAPRGKFTRLATAMDEVSQRVGAPVPHRVIITPGAEAYVFSRRLVRRLFRRELVLGLGAGALPLLSEVDLKAILAHELAHYRHGDTALHAYCGGAEAALSRLFFLFTNAYASPQRSGHRNIGAPSGRSGLLTWPIRIVWIPFHLLRMRESRMAEFAADRVAADTYGASSFVNGLTGLCLAANSIRATGRLLVRDMRKQGGHNLYAELRSYYAALPPAAISELRVKAAQDFRSLKHSHPSTPDRLRAVYGLGALPPSEPYRPAFELLVPADAPNADALETQLTKLWLNIK